MKRAVNGALDCGLFSDVVVVFSPGWREQFLASCSGLVTDGVPVHFVEGGKERQESVHRGLELFSQYAIDDIVMVHDAARCATPSEVFSRVYSTLTTGAPVVVPAIPVVDSLRHITGGAIDRSPLRAVQTPQGFQLGVLREAHQAGGADATDDASLAEKRGYPVTIVDGHRMSLKVTEPYDVTVLSHLIPHPV